MSTRWPRRALLAVTGVAGAALLAALAAWILANSRFEVATARGEDGALTVETDLPAATCRKVLTADFPWVRFECDAREPAEESGDGGAAAPPVAPASP